MIAVPDMPDCMVVLVRCFGGVDDGVGLRQMPERMPSMLRAYGMNLKLQ